MDVGNRRRRKEVNYWFSPSKGAMDKMDCRPVLNVVIRELSLVWQLPPIENNTLLYWRYSFLVVYNRLDIANGAVPTTLYRNPLSREC